MNQSEEDAIKRALAEEFGLTGIDDPEELRLLVRTKMAEMNSLDRAAFEINLGRILNEAKSGGPPKTRFIILAYVIFALIAWFIWRPLTVVVAIFVSSNIRRFAIRYALFWTPGVAIAIGGTYGILIAVLVRIGTALTNHTTTVGIALGILGFFAAGYIGHVVPTERYLQALGDEKRLLARMGACGCYLVVLIALLLCHFIGLKT